MVVNFKTREISQDAHKLTRTSILIQKQKNDDAEWTSRFIRIKK